MLGIVSLSFPAVRSSRGPASVSQLGRWPKGSERNPWACLVDCRSAVLFGKVQILLGYLAQSPLRGSGMPARRAEAKPWRRVGSDAFMLSLHSVRARPASSNRAYCSLPRPPFQRRLSSPPAFAGEAVIKPTLLETCTIAALPARLPFFRSYAPWLLLSLCCFLRVSPFPRCARWLEIWNGR